MERHVKRLYPDQEEWDAGDVYRSLAGLTIGGYLDLSSLTSAKGLVLPTTIRRYLDLMRAMLAVTNI